MMEIILQNIICRSSNFNEDLLLKLVSLFNSRASYITRRPSHPLRKAKYALPMIVMMKPWVTQTH